MKKRGGVINLLAYKRFNTILDFLEKEEIIVYNKILKLEKIKLDVKEEIYERAKSLLGGK